MNVLILFESKVFTLNIMRCLADAGVRCYVFSPRQAWDVRLSKYCCDYVKCGGASYKTCLPELIEKINHYCIRHKISCIIPGDYQTTLFLAKVSGQLKVKTTAVAEPQMLETLSNKWTFAQLLKANSLPQPQTFLAENFEQYEAIPLPFPRVVKPLEGGGRWIMGRNNPGSYVKRDRAEYLACAQDGKAFPLLVQEFIPGTDVGLNIFAVQGKLIAWTMQEFVGGDRLKFFRSPELLKLGERLVALINFQGVANIDLRIDQRDGVFKFIECNPRFWGSLRASKWSGVNFPVLTLNTALGQDVSALIQHQDIEYAFPSRVLLKLSKGNLAALKGLPEATLKDLGQILADPLSCLYSIFNRNRV